MSVVGHIRGLGKYFGIIARCVNWDSSCGLDLDGKAPGSDYRLGPPPPSTYLPTRGLDRPPGTQGAYMRASEGHHTVVVVVVVRTIVSWCLVVTHADVR